MSKVGRFRQWLMSRQLPIVLPTPEDHLVLYASYRRAHDNVLVNTIRSDVAAIRHWNIINGYSFESQTMRVLQKCYAGMLRTGGASKVDSRLPATVSFLRQAMHLFNLYDFDQLVMFTSLVVAVFGMLRIGEFTIRDRSRNQKHFLTCGSLSFEHKPMHNITFAKLFLAKSKTDYYHQGVNIILGKVSGDLSRRSLLHHFWTSKSNDSTGKIPGKSFTSNVERCVCCFLKMLI